MLHCTIKMLCLWVRVSAKYFCVMTNRCLIMGKSPMQHCWNINNSLNGEALPLSIYYGTVSISWHIRQNPQFCYTALSIFSCYCNSFNIIYYSTTLVFSNSIFNVVLVQQSLKWKTKSSELWWYLISKISVYLKWHKNPR